MPTDARTHRRSVSNGAPLGGRRSSGDSASALVRGKGGGGGGGADLAAETCAQPARAAAGPSLPPHGAARSPLHLLRQVGTRLSLRSARDKGSLLPPPAELRPTEAPAARTDAAEAAAGAAGGPSFTKAAACDAPASDISRMRDAPSGETGGKSGGREEALGWMATGAVRASNDADVSASTGMAERAGIRFEGAGGGDGDELDDDDGAESEWVEERSTSDSASPVRRLVYPADHHGD